MLELFLNRRFTEINAYVEFYTRTMRKILNLSRKNLFSTHALNILFQERLAVIVLT